MENSSTLVYFASILNGTTWTNTTLDSGFSSAVRKSCAVSANGNRIAVTGRVAESAPYTIFVEFYTRNGNSITYDGSYSFQTSR